MIKALGKTVLAVANHDTVESVGIQSLPGQGQEVQFAEHVMQRLSFGQTAHIMEARIVHHGAPAVTLHTASRLMLTFQNEHFKPLLAEQVGTDQSAQAASYDNYIIHLHL